MPLFLIEGSKDGGLFGETIIAANIEDAERAAVAVRSLHRGRGGYPKRLTSLSA